MDDQTCVPFRHAEDVASSLNNIASKIDAIEETIKALEKKIDYFSTSEYNLKSYTLGK